MMNKIKEYLTNPTTWIAFWVFLFGLGWTYQALNNRIENLETQQIKYERQREELDIIWIKVQLTEIQTDLQRVKNEMTSFKK